MKNNVKSIAALFMRVEDKTEIEKLIMDLLTPAEIKDVSERIKIVELLIKGETQRNIASKLGLSISTVSRGSTLVQYGKGVLLKLLS